MCVCVCLFLIASFFDCIVGVVHQLSLKLFKFSCRASSFHIIMHCKCANCAWNARWSNFDAVRFLLYSFCFMVHCLEQVKTNNMHHTLVYKCGLAHCARATITSIYCNSSQFNHYFSIEFHDISMWAHVIFSLSAFNSFVYSFVDHGQRSIHFYDVAVCVSSVDF